MRYKVTLEVSVDAPSVEAARAKIQKLADVLNKKDWKNNAWVPKLKVVKESK